MWSYHPRNIPTPTIGAGWRTTARAATAARAGAPITTVVLNNGDMATYPGGYPTARELFGTTEMTGDYAKIAEGMGAVGGEVIALMPQQDRR